MNAQFPPTALWIFLNPACETKKSIPSFSAFFWTPKFTGWLRKHPSLDAYSLARSRRGKKKRARTYLKLRRGRLAVLTYLLGPFLAVLPRQWRNLLPRGSAVVC